MLYPKIGTLFKLAHWEAEGRNKNRWEAVDELLPDTAGLHYVDPETIVVTEKLDGSNMWVNLRDGAIGKRSGLVTEDKSDRFHAEVGASVLENIREMGASLAPFGWPELIVYGELVGPKVNSSGRLFPDRQMVVFDIAALDENGRARHFFRWDAVKAFCEVAGLTHVPEIYWSGSLEYDAVRVYVQEVKSAVNPAEDAEGIVVRDGSDTSTCRRRIAKIRRKDFPDAGRE